MPFEFNPKKTTDDQGIGKIHLGDTPAQAEEKASGQAKRKTWIIAGAGGAALVIALSGIFALSSGKKVPEVSRPGPAPYTETHKSAEPPAPYVARQADRDVSAAQSIREKVSAIYRDDATAYLDQNGARAEAYLGRSGQEVAPGQDFALHVALFNKGGVSVLVAAGPYAGSRVEFMPVLGGQRVTYTRVGQESGGLFQALPVADRTVSTAAMQFPQTQGSGVALPAGAASFEKIVPDHGKNVTAFTLKGSPQDDGVFSVKIWNGDTYTFDLKTGQYTVDSVFLFHPNYQQEYKETGVKVSRSSLPVVKGVLDLSPSVTPKLGRAPGL